MKAYDGRPWALGRSPALGAILFFALAPGTVAGVVPYLLTRWNEGPPSFGTTAVRTLGALLILIALTSLLESFARFVAKGRGTPAPIAPPRELVVSGQYRLVRNPMYVALVGVILGQALLLGRMVLLAYAAVVWAVCHLWVVAYEEPHLRRRFGASYEAYCSHVSRWLPGVRAWK